MEFCVNVLFICGVSFLSLRVIENASFAVLSRKSLVEIRMGSSFCLGIIAGSVLEFVSIGFRSISLGFRFLANLASGHVLSDILNSLRSLSTTGNLFIWLSIKIGFCIYEFAVLGVQVFVVIALCSVYAGIV